jgi:hypothetical protein
MKFPKLNLHDTKTQLALGGGGAVVAFALYRRHQAAAAAAANPQGASGSVTPGSVTSALDASSIENNIADSLQPQIDALSGQIAGLSASNPTPTPTPPPGPPGSTPPPPAHAPTPLPPVNASSYPLRFAVGPNNGLPGNPLLGIGAIVGPDLFSGRNVTGGAPVYAREGNWWVQNFNPKTLPKGTPLATLRSFANRLTNPVTNERLG